MNSSLTIITVGFNEERNLPFLYNSLQKVENILPIRKIYIDQSSDDNSVEIANQYRCEVVIHPNQGYADPDKKWAVEELCQDDDWILIIDADETISPYLAQEIKTIIEDNLCKIGNIKILIDILGGPGQRARQMRLFKKKAMKVTDDIHYYLIPRSHNIKKLHHPIINMDQKLKGKEIYSYIEKNNRYSEKELLQRLQLPKWKIIRRMFSLPILRFFGHGIIHRQFLRGIPGLIVCTMFAQYQWLIYAKLYESKYIR